MSFIPSHVLPPGYYPTTVYVTIVGATGPIYIGGDSIVTLNQGQRPPADQDNPDLYGHQAAPAYANPLWAAGDPAGRGPSGPLGRRVWPEQGSSHLYERQAAPAHINPLWAAGDLAGQGPFGRHARPGHAETPQPSPGGAIKRGIVEHATLPEHPIEPWPPSERANKVDLFGVNSLPWPPALTSIRDPVEEETLSEDPIEPWPPSGDKKKRGRYALGNIASCI